MRAARRTRQGRRASAPAVSAYPAALERSTGIGNVGLLFNIMSGSNKNRTNDSNEVKSSAYELGAFWRISKGPFYAFARGTVAQANFDSTRTFVGSDFDWHGLRAAGDRVLGRPPLFGHGRRFLYDRHGRAHLAQAHGNRRLLPPAREGLYRDRRRALRRQGRDRPDGRGAHEQDLQRDHHADRHLPLRQPFERRHSAHHRSGSRPAQRAEQRARQHDGAFPERRRLRHHSRQAQERLAGRTAAAERRPRLHLAAGRRLAPEQTAGSPAYNVRFSLSVAF